MTPEAQRIAIAEACGWQVIHDSARPAGGRAHQIPPGKDIGWFMRNGEPFIELPNYPHDLNAMHEAEKVLDVTNGGPTSGDCLRYVYSRELYKLCPDWTQPFRAPAALRAEAFLRALNLWKE